MDKIIVQGGRRLQGEVAVSGSKNAALPILISSLLTSEPCIYQGIPHLVDISTTLKLLSGLGVDVDKDSWAKDSGDLTIRADRVKNVEASYDLVKTMRASFLVTGPLLARFGRAHVSTPGGCAIGTRPVNLHLKGLAAMGASIDQVHGYVEVRAKKLRGAKIYLDLPSVGATENLMMTASLAEGTTVIENAAKEPEIEDLAAVLNKMGAEVQGAGSDIIRIEGTTSLRGVKHRVIPDRIEAASFVIAGVLTGGNVVVTGARPAHLDAFSIKLKEAGIDLAVEENSFGVKGNGKIKSVDLTTLALSRISHRPAGPDDGPDVRRRRCQRYHGDHFREPFYARSRARPHGRRYPARRQSGGGARRQRVIRRAGDGDGSASQRVVDPRGTGGQRHHRSFPGLSLGSGLRTY